MIGDDSRDNGECEPDGSGREKLLQSGVLLLES
jgi:hypothetical protein